MSRQPIAGRRQLLEDALRGLRDARAQLEASARARHAPIAIVGAGVRLPHDVDDLDSYWRLLCDGVDPVRPLVSEPDGRRRDALLPRPSATGPRGAQLSQIDGFDAEFFGISPAEAERMDPQQRLILEVAWEAIEDAGLPLERLQRSVTGVFLGLYGSDYMTLQLSDPEAINAYSAPGSAHSIAANRLSYTLDLHGPSLVVDTACSSSLVAIVLACRALRQGDCDIALVGGVNVILSSLSTLITGKVLPLAPSGRCRPFDAGADGIVRGEGCGILVLERISTASGVSRRIRGLVRGAAMNSDGRTNGLTAPSPAAQVDVLRRALADAAADPSDVVYVEAHGTGTPLGDPIEVEALNEVYGAGDTPCALGSVKSNLGHLEAAAGIAGVIKAMLVLEHRRVPPVLHFHELNPEIDLDQSRLSIPTTMSDLAIGGGPSLAGVSSFGFGGTNAHIILEGAPARPMGPASPHPPGHLTLPVSARSPGALSELARRYASLLRESDAQHASEVCAAAACGRSHHRHRLCASAATTDGLLRQLDIAAVAPRSVTAAVNPRIAFVFGGQGTQWAGMGADLLASQPVAREEIERCDTVASKLTGWSIIEELKAPDGASRLEDTEVAQLSVAALQLGLVALWRSWGVQPDAVVGHSMGEVVAACTAGVLGRQDTFELLLQRARLAERAARGGAMASIGLSDAEIAPLVAAAAGRVAIAAINGPRSTVIAGDAETVAAVVDAAAATGAETRVLRVRYAFHSPLLQGVGGELQAAMAHLRPRDGGIALYSTVTGDVVPAAGLDATHWGRNLTDAVQLRPAVVALARDGFSVIVEIGPHPVLLRDIGGTLEAVGAQHLAVGSLRRDDPATPALHRSLGDLYVAGIDPCWERVFAVPATPVSLPAYPWQRRRHWLTSARPARGGGAQPNASDGERLATPCELNPAAAATSADRVRWLTGYLRERIAEAAGMDRADEVPADEPMASLGLESLTIVELKNQVERELHITVPLAALLEGGSPSDLARTLAGEIEAPPDDRTPNPGVAAPALPPPEVPR